eukprot:CAMPEP_0179193790 /NCGR_PEP_ID=MMETSP0796-20121207/96308_1 /TAXON_ID=73915 /ORGANISM="Pyrodinium bahamense, Strain pbaha01" /LENGTH=536 /DNA_ID=CAMNT_0020898105 /DNA_START=1 /DNA_END=1609 /DNA_ORIENTATION=+
MEQLLDFYESPGAAASTDIPAARPALQVVSPKASASGRLEELIREFFSVLDLDGDGSLQQPALLKLNRRLALLHHRRMGEDSPPPAPLLDPAALYPSFREHLLRALADHELSVEDQEAVLVHFIALERHLEEDDETAIRGLCRALPRCPQGTRQPENRHPKEWCAHPLTAAQEYGPAAFEASNQVIQAATRSLTGQARRLASHAAPHLAALADSTKQASVGAATGMTSTIGTYWARARAGLRQQDCLASAPRGARLELGPKVVEKRRSAECGQCLGGGPSPHRTVAQPRATLQPPGGTPAVEGAKSLSGNPAVAATAEQPAPPERMPDEVGAAATTNCFAIGKAAAQRAQLWRYAPEDCWHVDIRSMPDVNGPRTGTCLQAGEVFRVCEERRGTDGVLYLCLADGRGWVFDQKPGVGTMCVRADRPIPVPVSVVEEEDTAPDAQCFWQLTSPFQQPASSQPLLQLASQMAAQTAKDHDPGAVPWARSSTPRLSMAVRRGGAEAREAWLRDMMGRKIGVFSSAVLPERSTPHSYRAS